MKPEYFEDLINLCTDISKQESKLLPLCAAENIVSPFSKIPLDTFLQEKYIMGGVIEYQEHSNFIGSKKLYEIYELLVRQCNKLYGYAIHPGFVFGYQRKAVSGVFYQTA